MHYSNKRKYFKTLLKNNLLRTASPLPDLHYGKRHNLDLLTQRHQLFHHFENNTFERQVLLCGNNNFIFFGIKNPSVNIFTIVTSWLTSKPVIKPSILICQTWQSSNLRNWKMCRNQLISQILADSRFSSCVRYWIVKWPRYRNMNIWWARNSHTTDRPHTTTW